MKKATVQYIKCPRCELNYILKKDKFCDVCKSEMKAGILKENDMEELEYLEEGMELCPICKVNYFYTLFSNFCKKFMLLLLASCLQLVL